MLDSIPDLEFTYPAYALTLLSVPLLACIRPEAL